MENLVRTALAGLVVTGSLLAVSPVSAAEKHAHGEGELKLAIEGNKVVIELTAPGSDIVGFEHKPSLDADRKAVAAAAAMLKDGTLYVIYSIGKEDIALSWVPLRHLNLRTRER